ncbi:hypothetical protein MO973_43315 [Paenibacillus sp. TRM 82003]|nr:hypothetical protein [Paenibacillus sp. TRM 82003]
MQGMRVKIEGAGVFMPEPDGIVAGERFGSRGGALAGVGSASLASAMAAIERALASGGIDAESLDMIVYLSDSPSAPGIHNARTIRRCLGAERAQLVYDIELAGGGALQALDRTCRVLAGHPHLRRALLVGGARVSAAVRADGTLDEPEPHLGAVALALGKSASGAGFIDGGYGPDYEFDFFAPPPATRAVAEGWAETIRSMLHRNRMEASSVGHWVFVHSPSTLAYETAEAIGLDPGLVAVAGDKYGAADVAGAFAAVEEALRESGAQAGDRVVVCSAGEGHALSCALLER